MSLGMVALVAFVVVLLGLGAYQLGYVAFIGLERLQAWRAHRRRTAGRRLELPRDRVVRVGGRR